MSVNVHVETLLNESREHWVATVIVSALCIILFAIGLGDGTPTYSQFPSVGQGFLKPWLTWTTADRWRLHEIEPLAYAQHSKMEKPWHVTFWGLKFLIMPAKYLRDLRVAERHSLNLAVALSDALNMKASVGDVPTANTMEIDVVSKHLNAQLAETVPLLNEEAEFVFGKEVGQLDGWYEFAAMDLSSKLVHYISNRILVGPELCRRSDYRVATESLNMSHVIYGALWNFLPLGPFRKPFYNVFCIPYRMQIRRAMKKFLIPNIEYRMLQRDDPAYKKNLDTIQLMVDMPLANPQEDDAFRHSIRILHLHFASTGSTIVLVHNTLWQLLQQPECITEIRNEIGTVLEKYGSWDSQHTLNHLHLLDSFLREMLRFHTPSALICLRLARQPVTLHDGFLLKHGTRIAFPAQSIQFDPDNYQDPRTFLPFRFAGSGPCSCDAQGHTHDTGRLKVDAPDEKYLPFGYGKQSCPGRFFALKVVKLILGRLLWEYDIQSAGQLPRSPTNGTMEGFFLPTKNVRIELKSRRSP